MYAMDMRQYDPAIARWVAQDPIVHHNQSPYNAFDGNPVYFADPSGGNSQSYAGLDAMGRPTHDSNGFYIMWYDRGPGPTSTLFKALEGTDGGTRYLGGGPGHFEEESAQSLVALMHTLIDRNDGTLGMLLDGLEALYYGEAWDDNGAGVEIIVGYNETCSGLDNFDFIQNVTSTHSKSGAKIAFEPQIDAGRGDKSRRPFYLDKDEISKKKYRALGDKKQREFGGDKYEKVMRDRPTRFFGRGDVVFRAELTIIGMNSQGNYVPIATINYGFDLKGKNLIVHPIRFSEPSLFQMCTIEILNSKN